MTALVTKIVEKPWGKDALPPQFDVPQGKRIGEVWFEPPPALPDILVKYIFTSEKLSVQVHPSDAQAEALGESDRGKEECWLVIDAEPDAVLGIGFTQPLDTEAMREAALDGSIEGLMQWHPVSTGDFFYIPAGTVHAIGAGVSLIEIQQASDITYRLYDYGRPRELHLERGLQVAKGETYSGGTKLSWPERGAAAIVRGPYFSADLVSGPTDDGPVPVDHAPSIVIPVVGEAIVDGQTVQAGEAAYASDAAAVVFGAGSQCIVVRRPG
ncbi:class I mannose-6-phosphate isomerase [Novosphingobium sp.]|uniref:class I mannose-6-phosphate isomerase n=1 Tax=Novosphingobium sp. TaxID=1874826 RepID=UPI0026236227|nr:class I mannose-6-phosphate isomerase [Novosphingobium sp.]